MSDPIQAVLIGAGQRGSEAYAPYALLHPEQIRFVAVAEPNQNRRQAFARRHHISPENQFSSWEELLALRPALGEAALVCTQDWQHVQPSLAALQAGYHVLLEKPMATTENDCRGLVQASREAGRQLHICHVLRYTRHFKQMREIVQSGRLGEVIDVDHRENVAFWHMAHSYVRGNWRSSRQSSPMILAKCCHDLDILPWVLNRRCERLSSVGGLSHFKPENAPAGAPARCLDGCPASQTCPYFAPWLYLGLTPLWRSFVDTASGPEKAAMQIYLKAPWLIRLLSPLSADLRILSNYQSWPVSVLADDPTPEKVLEALRSGPYGRCVYHCDNDVVDHQVVSMEFTGGLSVSLGMHGHSHNEYRTTRIEGTRGRLLAEFGLGGAWIQVDEHRSDRRTRYNTSAAAGSGHGGGDFELMAAFIESLRGGDAETARTTAEQALESHLLAFAAEKARLEGQVVQIKT
jgi:predicted dehydrogenase